jgi:D-arabinose 1-dehydrogenase-like Zn-dependent alcohol dehydrogenase
MRALRFHGPGDLRLDEVAAPNPADGEVVMTVDACGVCGSDIHFLDGSARTGMTPVILGHEIAATVTESHHPAWSEGDPVVVAAGVPCNECPRCLGGRPNLCEHMRMTGIDFDGGWAESLVAPARALFRRPPNLSPIVAAVAADAGATAYHALTRRGEVAPGQSVTIIGIGGLGSFGVQLAKSLGAAPVIAVDTDQDALERARSLGADETVLAGPEVSVGRAVKMLTDGGVDVAVEFVGRAATVDASIKSIRPGGLAVAVGVGNEPMTTIPPVLWARNEYELRGSFGSLDGDIELILGWLDDGTLQPPPLEEVSLDEAEVRIPAVAGGETISVGRLVVCPGA